MAKKTPRHFTTAPAADKAPMAKPPTKASVVAIEDYSALNVPPEIVAAAGLRNGMQPEAIHEAIKAIMIARALR